MSAAAAAILDGMPDARDLHRLDSGGQIMIFAGPVLLFRYSETEKASRNLAVTSLRQLRFSGKAVAEATGLTPNYVATMYQAFLRDGTAALIRQPGRPRETGEESWDQAREWRGGGGGGGAAAAVLAAAPVTESVYYVDDYFTPYTGAKPAAKGRDSKRGRAERGHAGTHVT